MKLYARRSSSNSQKVLWFLGEIGLDYEFVDTGGDAGGLDDPSYRKLNPNGKVPTWVDQNGSVWESQTILKYLAAEYSPSVWWPEVPFARSQIDRWLDWSQSKFDRAFMSLFWAYWRTPEEHREEETIVSMLKECKSSILILNEHLSPHSFLAGEGLSLADIPAGSIMYRYVNLDVTDELPGAVNRWYEKITHREAYQKHVMRPFDELKGKVTF